jgi:hypothetical protein
MANLDHSTDPARKGIPMARARLLTRLLSAAIPAAVVTLAGFTAQAADLFYNYYVPGNPPAQAFLSPRPTPPLVGHTYITYQPFYPNEFLYHHKRTYARYDGIHRLPMNKTHVSWKSGLLPYRVWCPHRYPEIQLQYAP